MADEFQTSVAQENSSDSGNCNCKDSDDYSITSDGEHCIEASGSVIDTELPEEQPHSRAWWIFQVLLGLILPVVLFYLLESFEHNPFTEVRGKAQIFNILILELLGWGLFCVCKKMRTAQRILIAFLMLFGLTNHYVMAFRSTPFVPWDIFSVRTAFSVAGNYSFAPGKRVLLVCLAYLVIFVFLQFYHFSFEAKIYYRLIPFVLVCLALFGFGHKLQDEAFQRKQGLYPFLFTPAYMTKVNGMLVTFTMDLKYIAVDKPSGYSKEKAKTILEKYEEKSNEKGASEVLAKEDYPNIIVIMDEAFSDVGVLSDFETNMDYMPFVHKILAGEVENTISGYLNVSVCGGNTANTEFEFLTGNTMAFLPMGSIPYQQYIKDNKPSLASHLKSLGYDTYGMHPYNASGWNRDKVYPWLGLDTNLFYSDFESKYLLRNYVSDASDFAQIKRIYENKANAPLFVFNVTMQNHGSYSASFSNFTPTVKVEGAYGFSLQQYLSLIRETDYEIENLIDYFSEQEERTVIVFFGDHQPNDYTVQEINGAKEEYERYRVPYFIWANYEIEGAINQETSANYLSAQLLNYIDMPLSAYQSYLLSLEKDFPVISAVRLLDENEQDTNLSEAKKSSAGERLKEYQRLQYYLMFDYKENE